MSTAAYRNRGRPYYPADGTFTARFNGYCPTCDRPYGKGDQIQHIDFELRGTRRGEYVHATCPTRPTES